MQAMELVDIEDVYPYEENDMRMNPRDVSSKECQRYIEQLAEQFKYNRLNPGQPRIRPILYRDGGIYWIIDGECRYWAMKKIGTKKFYADVFDDIADAETARQEAAKAMVETDAKRTLTTEEMSRGVQTMLSLAIPDEEVAAAAHMDKGAVKKTRRAMKSVGQDAYYMTLDRLMAIAEFDGTAEGDAKAAKELTTCKDDEWRDIYAKLLTKRKLAIAKQEARKICLFLGAKEFEETPDRTVYVERFFLENIDKNKLKDVVMKTGDALFGFDGYWLEIRRPETGEDIQEDKQLEKEREERIRLHDQRRELWDREVSSRESWIAEHANDPKSMRTTAATCADRALELAMPLIEHTDCDVSFSPSPVLTLIGFSAFWMPDIYSVSRVLDGNEHPLYANNLEKSRGYIELTEAMGRDGYSPTEIGSKFLASLKDWERKQRD